MVRVVSETHSDYVTCEKVKPILYAEFLKALCGLLKSALKFYIKAVVDLKEEVFEINPHDGSMDNKLVNGKYQTVCWHVDDLKVSHIDPTVNDILIQKLRKKHETIEKGSMKVTSGNFHTFLGMLFNFSTMVQVKISMLDCIMDLIKEFPEK